MRYATHALKDEGNFNIERIAGQTPVAAIPAVNMTAVKDPPTKWRQTKKATVMGVLS